MFERLIPHSRDYFDPLVAIARGNESEATMLVSALEDLDSAPATGQRIEESLRSSRAAFRDLRIKLDSIMVTPIDRDDIFEMGTQLTKVSELIRDAALRIVLYRLSERSEAAVGLAHELCIATSSVLRATLHLPRGKELDEALSEVHASERRADALYFAAMGSLFAGGTEPMDVLRWKDLFTLLEDATDECHRLANTLQGIALSQT